MSARAAGLATLAAASLYVALAAQERGGGGSSRLQGRLPPAAVAAVDSIVARARSEGLPEEPLIQKALEGQAKGASADRIAAAVAESLRRLRDARELLLRAGASAPSPIELAGVSLALDRGLPEPVVHRLVAAQPGGPHGPALHAVADLMSHGFDSDSAAELIVQAVRAGLAGVRLLDVAGAAIQETQAGYSRPRALAVVRGRLPNIPEPAPAPRGLVTRARRPVTDRPR